ncbi:hypothetical protein PR003_g5633 [Phytophthora rubi]|uniref:Uncharacterized protein n=1 Tax=Phytophthora rubi TaxID=129364 RepID=A0A6A3HP93_9STRA|nr:hypothetical protein PR002_g26651 [Phytophthora rubi]KAE8972309.1 hypothetical protein PR001_g26649 [Phytophthora rubi]KAE9349905.1 hypothetical protein PR003_g5633 [Phytophthora rubi]
MASPRNNDELEVNWSAEAADRPPDVSNNESVVSAGSEDDSSSKRSWARASSAAARTTLTSSRTFRWTKKQKTEAGQAKQRPVQNGNG